MLTVSDFSPVRRIVASGLAVLLALNAIGVAPAAAQGFPGQEYPGPSYPQPQRPGNPGPGYPTQGYPQDPGYNGHQQPSSYERDPAYAEFYQALDPHGEWIVHARYGESWVPYANQDREWRPYSRGHWVYTEEHGWYWESDEEFGWVVYHYGRWLLDPRAGWMWVPGRDWGPAWVAWRQGEEAIGWAPLPPEAELAGSGEMQFEAFASPRYSPMWMFVAPALMTMPFVYRHFYPHQRSSFYFGQTRYATSYSYRGDRHIYNRGIDRRFIEARAQRPVPVLQVRPMAAPRDGFAMRRQEGDRRQVGIYRPQIAPQGQAPGHVPGGGGFQRPPQGGSFQRPLQDGGIQRAPQGGGFGGAPNVRPGVPGAIPGQGTDPAMQRGQPAAVPPGFGGDPNIRQRPPIGGSAPTAMPPQAPPPGPAAGSGRDFPFGPTDENLRRRPPVGTNTGPQFGNAPPPMPSPGPGGPPQGGFPGGRPFGGPGAGPGGAQIPQVPQPVPQAQPPQRPQVQAPPPPAPPAAQQAPAQPAPVQRPPQRRPPQDGQPPQGDPAGQPRGPR